MSDEEELEEAPREARLRGKALLVQLLAEPSMLELGAFAARAKMTEDEVKDRWIRREVLAISDQNGRPRFPEWQLSPEGRLPPAIGTLFAILEGEWAVYRFLTQHHNELDGQTGLEAIVSGRSDEAIETAQGIVDGNFT